MKKRIKDIEKKQLIIYIFLFQTVMYLLAKQSPFDVHLLESKFDSKIPFLQGFIYFYISWYVLILLIPYIISKKMKIIFISILCLYYYQ